MAKKSTRKKIISLKDIEDIKPRNPLATNPLLHKGGAHTSPLRKLARKNIEDLKNQIADFENKKDTD
ncbi:hypothetical protein AwWohl_13530 [Gammaproteobacteria bacterium]|nr:hypothetical protein AwWohl_13530 [Gammaproteobacteria bacterium]